ncbi:uncharacterized protein [Paramormyrops kingsleyae]|uniref:uncharacterized protein isoform X4 n=1 Tax=Paramormyrops kingsleyae TaxID=1676925 RepID=UPI003B973611
MAVKQPKRRRSAAQTFKKKSLDQARAKSHVNIGEAFERWRDLRELKGMKTDEEVALFLLDRLEAALKAEATAEGGGLPGPMDEACVGSEEAEREDGAGEGHQDAGGWTEFVVKVETKKEEGQPHRHWELASECTAQEYVQDQHMPYGQEFVVKVEKKEEPEEQQLLHREPANDYKAQEAVRVKMEDRHMPYARKRPYAEGHGVSYSELREHKRSHLAQPPAKEEEEDFDFIQKIPVEDMVRGTVGPSSKVEHEQTVAMKTFSLESDSGEESETSVADSMEEDTFLYGENATLDITDEEQEDEPSTEMETGSKWDTVDTADQGPP